MRKLILSVVALVILTLIGCSYSCEDKALTRTAMTGRPAVQQQATPLSHCDECDCPVYHWRDMESGAAPLPCCVCDW